MKNQDRFWNPDTIKRIMDCDSSQLKVIAQAAGFNPATFFKAADFRGVDLRGQDLTGVDLSQAKFERAIADETTLLERGRRPIIDKRLQARQFIHWLTLAKPRFHFERLISSIKNVLGQSVPSCIIVDDEIDISMIMEALGESNHQAVFLNTLRGFIRRRVMIVREDFQSGPHESLVSGILTSFPDIARVPRKPRMRQLDLPMPDFEEVSPLRVPTVRRDAKLINTLKTQEGITDVWLALQLEGRRDLQRDIARVLAMSWRTHVLLGCMKQELPSAMKLVREGPKWSGPRIIKVDTFRPKGVVSYLDDVEHRSQYTIKFTAKFREEISELGTWKEVRDRIRKAVRIAVDRSNYMPVSVGVRDLRPSSIAGVNSGGT